MKNGHLNLVIGHKRPSFQIWPEYQFVTFVQQERDDFILNQAPDELRLISDALIGEYFFLFCLRRELEKMTNVQSVTIVQYRRFVTAEPVGTPSQNQSYSRTLAAEHAQRPEIGNLIRPKFADWLVSPIFSTVPNVMAQYLRCHPVRDFFRFLADSIDAGELHAQEAVEAAGLSVLIPAPSVGIFPVEVLIAHLKQLERCALSFRQNGFIARADYQRRAIGFCLERLHSYLILKKLFELNIEHSRVSGTQIVVSESASVMETI